MFMLIKYSMKKCEKWLEDWIIISFFMNVRGWLPAGKMLEVKGCLKILILGASFKNLFTLIETLGS